MLSLEGVSRRNHFVVVDLVFPSYHDDLYSHIRTIDGVRIRVLTPEQYSLAVGPPSPADRRQEKP